MKTRKERKTLKRESSQVKRGLTKKQSMRETKREKGEQLFIFEGLCFEYGV
jgi:hypothetical protein